MKKIVILLLAALPVVIGNAQSSKVTSAYRHLEDYKQNRDDESLAQAKEAIDLASENPDTKDKAKTQMYRGQIYFQSYDSKKRKAEEKLNNIADPNKRAITALQNTPTEDLEVAYKAFLKAKELDVKGNFIAEIKTLNTIGMYFDNIGRVNFNAKKYDVALSAFEHTYEISEFKDTTALAFAATSAEQAKNYEKAKIYYLKMVNGKQGRGNTYASLVDTYLMLKDTVSAMDALKRGRMVNPNDPDLLIKETNYFLGANKSIEALNNLSLTIQAKPTDPNLYMVRGNLYDNLANPKDIAGKDLEKPKDYEEKLKLAETDYKKAIELKPDYADALFNLGVLYFNNGATLTRSADQIENVTLSKQEEAKATAEFKKALTFLEKALEINKTDRATMNALSKIYARLQMTDKYNEMQAKLKK